MARKMPVFRLMLLGRRTDVYKRQLYDMLKAAAMLKGRTVSPSVSMSVSPGSRQVLTMLANCGALSDILASGARLLECACGPCIGMGLSLIHI